MGSQLLDIAILTYLGDRNTDCLRSDIGVSRWGLLERQIFSVLIESGEIGF
jgi:hypothetical protein